MGCQKQGCDTAGGCDRALKLKEQQYDVRITAETRTAVQLCVKKVQSLQPTCPTCKLPALVVIKWAQIGLYEG